MKLSTRARYGLRAMLELARIYGNGPLPVGAIAGNQNISQKYLYALLTTLRSAGLVRSVRGAEGGYALTRPPAQIKLSEIVQVLEGSLSLVDCVEDKDLCTRAEQCVMRKVWLKLSKTIEGELEHITLGDLTTQERTKEAG
jgi:Rrf2 family cysteine metabolism transcriptional repressor